jgi:hypothetical protein
MRIRRSAVSANITNAKTSDDGTGNCTTTVALGSPTTSDNCSVANVKAYVGVTEIILRHICLA